MLKLLRDNDKRPTGKRNKTIELDDGEKGNKNTLILIIYVGKVKSSQSSI